ncbi:MAG: DUF2071 domain-containing protein [Phycisphaerae bacterium]|jgi:uncharacterized protein YqjF (DUF2071 family)|nr:DUF2071 domain-containing protein [Phycisphaerae bacterium]
MKGRPPAIRMRWHDLLFLHWTVDVAAMRVLVPPELELDLWEGQAYVALVPFEMRDTRFRGLPDIAPLRQFPECNVRTYVRHGGQAGVWFFSLDAARLLPVIGARLTWSLPYVWSRVSIVRDGLMTRYDLRRVVGGGASHIVWRKGEPLPESRTGSLEHFLTERYWLFAKRFGSIRRGRVAHAPWSLRKAEVLELKDGLLAASGLRVSGAPHVLCSDGIDVEGWTLEASGGPRIGGGEA